MHNYSLSQTSLEQVFLNIAAQASEEAAKDNHSRPPAQLLA